MTTEAQPPAPSASKVEAAKGFWARVREHKVIQWGIAYLGAALALAHGAELLGHAFHWPEIFWRVVMIALVAGFPIALTVAWYHGHRGLSRISAGELSIVSVLLLIGAVFFAASLRPPDEHAASALANVAQAAAAAPANDEARPTAASTAPPLPNSIAVLPCNNFSPDPDNAYFAAGIHEEVLNQLVKISDLNVIARTSVLQFRARRAPLPKSPASSMSAA